MISQNFWGSAIMVTSDQVFSSERSLLPLEVNQNKGALPLESPVDLLPKHVLRELQKIISKEPEAVVNRFRLKKIGELSQKAHLKIRWERVATALCPDILHNNPGIGGFDALWHSTRVSWDALLDFLKRDLRLHPILEIAQAEFASSASCDKNLGKVSLAEIKQLAESTYKNYQKKLDRAKPISYQRKHWPIDMNVLQFDFLPTLLPTKMAPLLGIPLGFFEFLLLLWQSPSMEMLDLKEFCFQVKSILENHIDNHGRKACQNSTLLEAFEDAYQTLELERHLTPLSRK